MSSHLNRVRVLGKDGPIVPAIGSGLMGMSGGVYGTPPPDEERFNLLDRAVELGATFWDTSDIYGESEMLLNRWFKRTGNRDKIFLASKFGLIMDGTKFLGINSSAEYCKKACEASLTTLGVEYIDLYYAHHVNPQTPIEETMRALVELQSEGKIRHIGLCGISSTALRRACKIAPVAAVQVEYSPFVREIEGATGTYLLETCRELGISIVCSSPLGRGMLTGEFTNANAVNGEDDIRGTHFPWWSDENLPTNAEVVEQFKEFAVRKGCTVAQLTLAWTLHQGADFVPIPGTKKIKYLEENWGALDLHLTEEENTDIRGFVERVSLSGYRSVSQAKALIYVDTVEEV